MKIYGTVNILGEFWPQRTSDISEVEWTSEAEGRLLYDSDNYNLYYGTASKWQKMSDVDDLFSFGSTLIFASTLPTGWNIDSNFNDKAIMITKNTNEIGTAGGTWIITKSEKDGLHNHFTPAGLGLATPSHDVRVRTGDYHTSNKNHKHTFATTGEHAHSFDGSWRPASVKLAIGVYQSN